HKCKGTEGLIDEAKKMMKEDLTPEVKDAAIIAAIQKIEHYEISGYGTAKAFALEISLHSIAALLDETLNEEYTADDALTSLAVHKGVNSKAERATEKSLAKNKKPIAKAAPSKPTVPSKPKFTHKKPSPSPMQKTDKGPQKNINAGKSRSTASDSNTAKDQNSKTQQSINKSTNGNQGNRNKPLASAPAGTNKNNNRNAQPKLANPGNKPGSPDKGSKSSTSGQAKSTAPGKKDIKSQPGKNEGNRQNLKSK
ncbi:MAG: DUF892 family protein, partial [Ferruginibacter sp.]